MVSYISYTYNIYIIYVYLKNVCRVLGTCDVYMIDTLYYTYPICSCMITHRTILITNNITSYNNSQKESHSNYSFSKMSMSKLHTNCADLMNKSLQCQADNQLPRDSILRSIPSSVCLDIIEQYKICRRIEQVQRLEGRRQAQLKALQAQSHDNIENNFSKL